MRSPMLLPLLVLLLACEQKAPPLPSLSPNAPKDQPVSVEGRSRVEEIQSAIAPYVQQARQTYPAAKKRYLAGLPPPQVFFAVASLRDSDGMIENAFIAVSAIKNGRIFGAIASDLIGVKGFKKGDAYDFPEEELVDWLISRPDGSEEGNVVGKFLDEWQKTRNPR